MLGLHACKSAVLQGQQSYWNHSDMACHAGSETTYKTIVLTDGSRGENHGGRVMISYNTDVMGQAGDQLQH
jgi:hypothetical protein